MLRLVCSLVAGMLGSPSLVWVGAFWVCWFGCGCCWWALVWFLVCCAVLCLVCFDAAGQLPLLVCSSVCFPWCSFWVCLLRVGSWMLLFLAAPRCSSLFCCGFSSVVGGLAAPRCFALVCCCCWCFCWRLGVWVLGLFWAAGFLWFLRLLLLVCCVVAVVGWMVWRFGAGVWFAGCALLVLLGLVRLGSYWCYLADSAVRRCALLVCFAVCFAGAVQSALFCSYICC